MCFWPWECFVSHFFCHTAHSFTRGYSSPPSSCCLLALQIIIMSVNMGSFVLCILTLVKKKNKQPRRVNLFGRNRSQSNFHEVPDLPQNVRSFSFLRKNPKVLLFFLFSDKVEIMCFIFSLKGVTGE